MADFFTPGELPYDLTFAVMILLFSYFYTSIIFNSVDLAENLKKQGGFIPGVKPGASTADYIDNVLARVTLPGALFLALIALVPTLLTKQLGFQQQFGSTSVLIVVGVSARHAGPDRAAPDAPEVRQLHEERTHQVPGAAAAVHVG